MKPGNVTWQLYLRNGFGRRLAMLGEHVGLDCLIYNWFVMRQFHDEALQNARTVIPAILVEFPSAIRVLDVGCGSGAFAADFRNRGRKVVGLERSRHGLRLAISQGVDCRNFDLNRMPPADVTGPFDLVYCFEVAEHLPPDLGDRLVAFVTSFQAPVVFSAAPPGQGGTGHINEQPKKYWLERFARFGFLYDLERTNRIGESFKRGNAALWFQNNVMVLLPDSQGLSVSRAS